MKGDTQVIAHLNAVLRNELTAINQYFLHSRMLIDWGVNKLGKFEYGESIEEMNHADELIKRILFLEGLPNLQDLGKLYIGQSVKEILDCDLKLELEALPDLKDAIAHCETCRDFVSRELFQKILDDEEEHVEFIETQFALIERTGMENYIQLQSESVGE
ncbi:MAG: bacterioferritin [Rhodospirillaceae bacterium]